MKFILALIALFVVNSVPAFSQKQNVYFLKNDGTYVQSKDSADYIRIVREPDTGTVLYNILEYFPTGEKKMFGKSSTIDPITLEGATNTFYKNGKRKQVAEFKKGKQEGAAYDYFPNGKLYTIKYYSSLDSVDAHHKAVPQTVNIQLCNDSTGAVLVNNGNGHYIGYDDYKYVNEEGDVKNGYKEDEWKGTAESKKISYVEYYKKGLLVNGTATDSLGNKVSYHERIAAPSFPGGIDSFYRFLAANIVYPVEDRTTGAQGKVVLSFVVGKKGEIKKIKVLHGVTPTINNEAIRVLGISKWMPGKAFGRVSDFAYTLPISFSLQ